MGILRASASISKPKPLYTYLSSTVRTITPIGNNYSITNTIVGRKYTIRLKKKKSNVTTADKDDDETYTKAPITTVLTLVRIVLRNLATYTTVSPTEGPPLTPYAASGSPLAAAVYDTPTYTPSTVVTLYATSPV